MKTLAVLIGLLIFISSGHSQDNQDMQSVLPNSCGVLATQAYNRVKGSYWRAILFVNCKTPNRNYWHMVAIWQPSSRMNILCYDDGGTSEFNSRSHKIKDILKSYQEQDISTTVIDGHLL